MALKRGFAAMDPAKQREISSKGGKASHGGGRPRKIAISPELVIETTSQTQNLA